MLKLYENIKKNRERLGLSQQELAELTEYSSRSSIAKIEAGEVDIPESKIGLFAKAFKITPQQLMGWEENKKEESKKPDFKEYFTDPKEALYYLKNGPSIAAEGGYNLYEMTDEELLEFANGIVYLLDMTKKERKKGK